MAGKLLGINLTYLSFASKYVLSSSMLFPEIILSNMTLLTCNKHVDFLRLISHFKDVITQTRSTFLIKIISNKAYKWTVHSSANEARERLDARRLSVNLVYHLVDILSSIIASRIQNTFLRFSHRNILLLQIQMYTAWRFLHMINRGIQTMGVGGKWSTCSH